MGTMLGCFAGVRYREKGEMVDRETGEKVSWEEGWFVTLVREGPVVKSPLGEFCSYNVKEYPCTAGAAVAFIEIVASEGVGVGVEVGYSETLSRSGVEKRQATGVRLYEPEVVR